MIPALSDADRDVLIRTLEGETGGSKPQPIAGIAAVVHVVRNRVLKKGTNARTECMRRLQFSAWNVNRDGHAQFPELYARMQAMKPGQPRYEMLGRIVDDCWFSPLDFSDGALHYFAHKVVTPDWLKQAKRTVIIGDHTFAQGVPW